MWVGTVGMAELCSGEDGKRWATAACEQSRKKEVVLSRKTCQENLACICFFISPVPENNMSEKTNWL